MPEDYSIDLIKKLEQKFIDAKLYRPMRVIRYETGAELSYDVREVQGDVRARVNLIIEKFVGGGFAGQVYKIKITRIDSAGPIQGLQKDGIYAMKILIPPSRFSLLFRNAIYWLGFQGPFQLQSNPTAARVGALWQKFIRRGAKIRFGEEQSVVDIHALFIDPILGSCGELSEWVEGRNWRLEVDDRLDWLNQWRKGKKIDESWLGSPEYRAKYRFMQEFVKLLHDMGGHEFARQYEWSTCKSQPNCLKRIDSGDDPGKGLTAVDFRAGLALLPFLPMSPGDFKLILKGMGRGSLVQFDRGNLQKLEQFINGHQDEFQDMEDALEDLKNAEQFYRNSIPDITHNHFKLLYSGRLWSTMLESAIKGWRINNKIDNQKEKRLQNSSLKTVLFWIIGMVPFFGSFSQHLLGRKDWQKHYRNMILNPGYLVRSIRARMAEKIMHWHRQERVNEKKALKIAGSIPRFICHIPYSFLPAALHRFLTDRVYFKDKLDYLLVRPVRLYFKAHLREEWLRDMVDEGMSKKILSDEDAKVIQNQIKEPFIQKYLKCLAVHVCTLPVTQVVSVIVAFIYIIMNPELEFGTAMTHAGAIILAFQVVPISPGSIVRGAYVVYLVIHERNFKDYNIAVFLSFFKYIGYLAFPIQMAYRYPVLARFMAGHWANEAVKIVPVFGEAGALLEHWVYRLFYNWPLTLRRRIKTRIQNRASMKPRHWHMFLFVLFTASIFGIADYIYLIQTSRFPELRDIWWFTVIIPFISGIFVTLGAGGTSLGKRFTGTALCGALSGILYTIFTAILSYSFDRDPEFSTLISACSWRIFTFSIFSVLGAILAELKMADPELKKI